MTLRYMLAVAAGAVLVAGAANAATKDVDLMFVIDSSGSMSDEFTTLANNVEDFFNGIANDSRVGSLAGGLTTYTLNPTVEQTITTDTSDLESALNSATTGASGGTENGLGAIASLLPGGSLHGAAGWRNNTVKSTILLTDEDADDERLYDGNILDLDYADLAQDVRDAGYLNNIISDVGDWDDAIVPSSVGRFSLNAFTSNPTGFLDDFATAKLGEIEDTDTTPGGMSPIPLPASIPMLFSGLGLLGALRLRRKRTA